MPENSYLLTQVMQRYTIDPLTEIGHFHPMQASLGDMNREFITSLLHAFEDKQFNAADFEAYGIELVVDYIQRTHAYYLLKKLPEIEQSILLLSGLYTAGHPILAALQNFFREYCRDLTEHINEEEEKLLPYIVLLRNAVATPLDLSSYILARQQYSIARFLSEHHDTEDELKDIRETIRLYNPPATNESLYRILLSQLETFEQDLHVHAQMEELVLIPKARGMETGLERHLSQAAKAN